MPLLIPISTFQRFILGGDPLRFLDLARAGAIRVDISEPILAKVLRVLRDKFQWEMEKLEEVESLIIRFAQRVTPTQTIDVVKEDPPDNRILECAVEAQSDAIVTGDGDLLRLGQYGDIPIMKVSDFLRSVHRPPTES